MIAENNLKSKIKGLLRGNFLLIFISNSLYKGEKYVNNALLIQIWKLICIFSNFF